MKNILVLCSALSLLAGAGHAAQLYRWVDSKGNVEWRDTPPPPAVPAKSIQERRIGGNAVTATDNTPFATQLAAKNHPLVFWTGADCGKPCELARAYLNRRGLPYKEITPKDDPDVFKQLSPKLEVPLLMVGRQKLTGYLESEWDSALDAAGYPSNGGVVQKPAAPQPATPPAAAPVPPAATGAPNASPPAAGTPAPAQTR